MLPGRARMYFPIVAGEKSHKYPGKQAAQGGLHTRIGIAKAASIDTHNILRDTHLRSNTFFAVKYTPPMLFAARRSSISAALHTQ
jgi:polyisoprenoid-binding protein YceI